MEGFDGVMAAIELARQRQAQRAVPPPVKSAATATPAPAQRPPQAKPAQPAPQPPQHHDEPRPATAAGPLQAMFEDGNSLLRAVVAAEILGPPASMREHHLWNQSPNEPST